ncbi:MAG: aminotransferase class III-fold pyridoxal phosphate-dependent enzyme [Polyangiaceae bacterium]|nr:aminotransferase class III-fold pyridoxal phosphate-dependent enzyme [Polyangiaceae bacterium]
MKTSDRPEVQRYARHVNPHLVSLLGVLGYGRLFTRAQGERIEDHRGNSYLDALAGFGSVPLGHHPERLRVRFEQALDEEPWGEDEGPRAAQLKALLARRSSLPSVLLASSGAEAVDVALKIARASTGRQTILCCDGSYHGLNLGALSVAAEPRVRKPFAPLLPGCRVLPYGDLDALRHALQDGAAAFLLEPLQIEGGMRMPPGGYLEACRELCSRHGTLLILDEIQTGLGRCGHDFLWKKYGVKPDIVTLGKALGGSYCALSALCLNPELLERAERQAPGLVGPGPVGGVNVASAVALEFLSLLDEPLLNNVRQRGEELLEGLQRRLQGHPLVRGIRGEGLLVGVELGMLPRGWKLPLPASVPPPPTGHWIALKMLEASVICQPTTHRPDVLRLEPPLTVSAPDIAILQDRIERVLRECNGATAVLSGLVGRLGRQARAGWTF